MYAIYCMRLLLINAPHGFVREMSRRDHDLLIADGEVSHIEAELKHPRCEFLQFRGSKKIDSAAIRLLRQTVHRFKPDLIHAFLPASLAQSVIGCIGLKPRPIIMSFAENSDSCLRIGGRETGDDPGTSSERKM